MEENTSKEGMTVYEVGYHVAPFVSEENVAHEVSKVKEALEKIKAVVISEDSKVAGTSLPDSEGDQRR